MLCTSHVPWARMVQTWYKVALVSLPEAQKLLGLTSRTTIYRKARTGELPTVPDAKGRPLVESNGLAELWGRIVQEQPKVTSRRQAPPPVAPLDPPVAPPDLPTAPLDPPVAPAAPQPSPPPPPPPAASPPTPAPRGRAARADAVVVPPSGAADFDENGVPVYNVQRAWSEYEKRLHEEEKRKITTLERMQKEGMLVYREDIEAAQAAVNTQIMSRAEALPKQIKLDIPHLTLEEMAAIEKRVMQIFEAVAEHDYAEVPE